MWSNVQEPVRGLQTPLLCTGDLKTKLNGGIKKKKKKGVKYFANHYMEELTYTPGK